MGSNSHYPNLSPQINKTKQINIKISLSLSLSINIAKLTATFLNFRHSACVLFPLSRVPTSWTVQSHHQHNTITQRHHHFEYMTTRFFFFFFTLISMLYTQKVTEEKNWNSKYPTTLNYLLNISSYVAYQSTHNVISDIDRYRSVLSHTDLAIDL